MSDPSNEPVRIRDDGREGDRALLRAGPPAPPPGLQDRVRRSIEQRAAAPRSRRWWAVGLFGLLGAGTAFALGTSPGQQLLRGLLGAPPVVEAPLESAARRPDWQPLPAPPPPPPPPLTPAPSANPARPPNPEPPPRAIILQPGLRQPPGEWSMSGATGEPDRRPPPAPSLLRITYRGRTTTLRATATSIEGHLRGAAVSLRLEGANLTGKVGDQPVHLYLRNDEGGGSIAGEALGYALAPTDQGAIVRGWVPGHSVRVELSKAGLSFYPGCERALFPQSAGPGIYKGECADGQMMQVTVPPAFEAMPLFPRLVVLGLLLTDRDPVFRYQKPGLFPERL
jgi:hypothetical protein